MPLIPFHHPHLPSFLPSIDTYTSVFQFSSPSLLCLKSRAFLNRIVAARCPGYCVGTLAFAFVDVIFLIFILLFLFFCFLFLLFSISCYCSSCLLLFCCSSCYCSCRFTVLHVMFPQFYSHWHHHAKVFKAPPDDGPCVRTLQRP